MKGILNIIKVFTVAAILCCTMTESLSASKLYENGKIWIIKRLPVYEMPVEYPYMERVDRHAVVGDTIVCGYPCKHILSVRLDIEPPSHIDYIRYEQDGKIFNIHAGNELEPLIDFNLKPGDYVNDYTVVQDVFTITLRGYERKVFVLKSLDGEKKRYWIDGIGAIDNEYITVYPQTSTRPNIMACYKEGQCLYLDGDLNGFTDVSRIMEDSDIPVHIYDLTGIRVEKPLKGNLYIRNGKKIIW